MMDFKHLTQSEILLRAVCQDPEDCVARLAYADYCEEVGEEWRSQLIREAFYPDNYYKNYRYIVDNRILLLRNQEKIFKELNLEDLDTKPGSLKIHGTDLIFILKDEVALRFCKGFFQFCMCSLDDWLHNLGLHLVLRHPITILDLNDDLMFMRDKLLSWLFKYNPFQFLRDNYNKELWDACDILEPFFNSKIEAITLYNLSRSKKIFENISLSWARHEVGLLPLK